MGPHSREEGAWTLLRPGVKGRPPSPRSRRRASERKGPVARQRSSCGLGGRDQCGPGGGAGGREAGEVRAVKAACPVEGVARAARPHLPQQR